MKAARFVGEDDGPTKALAPSLIDARMIMDVPAENFILAMLAQEQRKEREEEVSSRSINNISSREDIYYILY